MVDDIQCNTPLVNLVRVALYPSIQQMKERMTPADTRGAIVQHRHLFDVVERILHVIADLAAKDIIVDNIDFRGKVGRQPLSKRLEELATMYNKAYAEVHIAESTAHSVSLSQVLAKQLESHGEDELDALCYLNILMCDYTFCFDDGKNVFETTGRRWVSIRDDQSRSRLQITGSGKVTTKFKVEQEVREAIVRGFVRSFGVTKFEFAGSEDINIEDLKSAPLLCYDISVSLLKALASGEGKISNLVGHLWHWYEQYAITYEPFSHLLTKQLSIDDIYKSISQEEGVPISSQESSGGGESNYYSYINAPSAYIYEYERDALSSPTNTGIGIRFARWLREKPASIRPERKEPRYVELLKWTGLPSDTRVKQFIKELNGVTRSGAPPVPVNVPKRTGAEMLAEQVEEEELKKKQKKHHHHRHRSRGEKPKAVRYNDYPGNEANEALLKPLNALAEVPAIKRLIDTKWEFTPANIRYVSSNEFLGPFIKVIGTHGKKWRKAEAMLPSFREEKGDGDISGAHSGRLIGVRCGGSKFYPPAWVACSVVLEKYWKSVQLFTQTAPLDAARAVFMTIMETMHQFTESGQTTAMPHHEIKLGNNPKVLLPHSVVKSIVEALAGAAPQKLGNLPITFWSKGDYDATLTGTVSSSDPVAAGNIASVATTIYNNMTPTFAEWFIGNYLDSIINYGMSLREVVTLRAIEKDLPRSIYDYVLSCANVVGRIKAGMVSGAMGYSLAMETLRGGIASLSEYIIAHSGAPQPPMPVPPEPTTPEQIPSPLHIEVSSSSSEESGDDIPDMVEPPK
jgi:hypothetical protein